ncbi:MAG TPA: manganese transporter, partial [Burkholderiaceae bacterium]|nr:manganese transporter [Burkholderiaceae bacterium]
GCVVGLLLGVGSYALRARRVANGELPSETGVKFSRTQLDSWRMPPLESLKPGKLTGANRIWMGVLRGYLLLAVCMVVYKVVQLAI